VLDTIARNNLVLATGHSSPAEVVMLIREARRRGIDRIIVTHAMLAPVRMSIEQMREAARLGGKLEFVYNALIGPNKMFDLADYVVAIRAVGAENCVLSSDLGQTGNPLHPDGFEAFLRGLAAAGLSSRELDIMSRENPAKVLALPVR
ncbi:MAG TPA: DUF6282 family protein, partial [Bryobacteraceae bacterium]|nr:DUF6282 family protein [Bryobacteraceae bacterium]